MRQGTLSATFAVARKEILTSLRDRQTALYSLVLPICLYPILFWVLVQGALVVQGKRQATEVRVGVASASTVPHKTDLTAALEAHEQNEPSYAPLEVVPLADAKNSAEARTWLRGELESKADERLDAVLFFPPRARGEAKLLFDSTDSRSTIAKRRIEERLPPLSARIRSSAARTRGHDPELLYPIQIENHDIAPRRDQGAVVLSLLLPLLLVVMAVMGAFFPAVDLTAGEKERGTAETTLLLPVPRLAVHQGKILAVCALSVVATFLNLAALGLSAEHLLATLAQDIQVEVPIHALISIAPLALLFAFFVSAALTAVAGLAATFKEGQAMLGPVQIVFIVPAFAGVIPGLELTPQTALIPVLNVVLAFRAMLLGKALLLEYSLTCAALLAYAALAITLAVRLLSRESVILSAATIPFTRLVGLFRSSGGAR